MYRSQRRVTNRKKSAPIFMILLVIILLSVAWYFINRDVLKSTKIKGSDQAITGYYDGSATSNKKIIKEPGFSFSLPDDWKEIAREKGPPYETIQWRSFKKGSESRDLKLWVNTIPTEMAVNRIMPITIVGNKILAGDISDNCVNFNINKYNPKTNEKVIEKSPGKWQGASFICDLGNYLRNLVGTSVVDGDYNATLKTKDGKDMKFFFVYTDHTPAPDYQVFVDALKSFEMN